MNEKSAIIQEFSRHYNMIALEQQRQVPDRMPTAKACEEMIEEANSIIKALQRLRDSICEQEFAISEQRMRDLGGKHRGDYDEEMMYGDDIKGQGFGGPDSKKRRGVCLQSFAHIPFSNSD
jgi:hypothetical protein